MSSEMVAKVARALAADACRLFMERDPNFANHRAKEYSDPTWNDPDAYAEAKWSLYVRQARAAIEAMAEPTEEMVAAGKAAWISDGNLTFSRRVWQAMLTAALSETEEARSG
jgi:hypothetical protein